MMEAASWSVPGAGGYYVEDEDVRCEGEHRGGRCDKLLAESLSGEARIKCPRCGTRKTYRRKPVDAEP